MIMNKTTLILFVFSFFIGMSFTALGQSETRNLGNFDEVKVATGVNLTLVSGNVNKAEIEVDGIDLDEVITKIDGDRLTIKVDSKSNWGFGKKSRRKVNVRLTYKNLEAVAASSGSRVVSDDVLANDELDFDASSGSSIQLEIRGNEVNADASSGASITLSGSTESFDVEVSSGSSVKASDLESNTVKARGSSGASVKVWAKESLKAKVSSGASVRYKGNPSNVDRDKSSGGSVTHI